MYCAHIGRIWNMNNYHTYDFPDSKCLVVCGDIHGEFNLLVNKICVQYQLRDAVVIVAGDCGFGFERKGAYDNMVRRNSKRMNEANNWIIFIRGNHDNPAYFDGRTFAHKRFLAIPDYSVVKANGHTILCIGGAVSVDRSYRIEAWEQNQKKLQKFGYKSNDTDLLTPNYYWSDEAPKFDKEILTQILVENTLDTVITHTAPSFCELQSKSGLGSWAVRDASLLHDVQQERSSMDAIFNALKGQSITHWCYGHFHQSWHSPIEGTLFKMLDIMELYEIR